MITAKFGAAIFYNLETTLSLLYQLSESEYVYKVQLFRWQQHD